MKRMIASVCLALSTASFADVSTSTNSSFWPTAPEVESFNYLELENLGYTDYIPGIYKDADGDFWARESFTVAEDFTLTTVYLGLLRYYEGADFEIVFWAVDDASANIGGSAFPGTEVGSIDVLTSAGVSQGNVAQILKVDLDPSEMFTLNAGQDYAIGLRTTDVDGDNWILQWGCSSEDSYVDGYHGQAWDGGATLAGRDLSFAAIPEPATISMIAFTCVGFLFIRRRRSM